MAGSDVSVSMDLEAKALYNDLAAVQTRFASFASKVTSEGEKGGKGFGAGFTSGFKSLGSAFKSTLGALGVGVGISAVVNKIEQVIDKGSQIHDLAAKFKVTAENLQLIGNAADLDDIPLQNVAIALNRIQITGEQATTPGSKVNKILEDLAINAETYKKADPAERFLQLSDAYNASGKSGQAYADIAQIIGTRNTAMLITMSQGRDKIQALGASMGIMSQQMVNDLDKAGDAIKTFNNRMTVGFAKGIVETKNFGGWLEWLNNKVKEGIEKTGLKPTDEAVKGLRAGAGPGAFIPGGGGFGGKGAGSEFGFGFGNIPPKEGGYGAETRDVYQTYEPDVDAAATEKRLGEEEAVSARRRHLLNLQAGLEAKGLTLGTAAGTDIDVEEGRLAMSESIQAGREKTAKDIADEAKAREEFFHPGKKLEEELGGLQADDPIVKLQEQTDILKEIRDNTADIGANQ